MTAKKEASIWRLAIVLTSIALIAALALTGVYALTKGPIEKGQREKKEKALQAVLPDYKGTVRDTVIVDADNEEIPVHLAIGENGELCGAGIETYTKKAFAGRFDLMVGFDAEGSIVNTEVIKAGETPGLGDKINKDKSDFALQFNHQNPAEFQLVVKKDGGDVDAITAATISSRAYCDAVQRAYDVFMKIKEDYHE
ncbi:MAG: RnfABCDGE type electron transport complex subunit G [Bacteroidales bacterium]|jgi:electron transport complex protein RnfG|nr:RnfABCDGE type electron transport complex subunit G [Bacteroidales bacterium]MBR5921719.1 RnfABCDGE type electron transport complex subunit G [Bacteroidales bacterium]MBR6904876.1 RnfABCDGE type electron transport complex subunit G [Bacteroidales bacterium]MCR4874031.1 RnfABCDGE type electron transport complex subunit G [Bacteroidales bacterium]